MLRLFVALILCTSYLIRDGVLADWSWDESIHHASVEHEHRDHSDHTDEHRNDDCCIGAHNFILPREERTYLPAVMPLITIHIYNEASYLPWTLAPPLRPPIA